MKIHYDNTELDIQVNDNSYRYRAIKGEHSLTLYYSLPKHLELPVGAWCEFENETYTLESPENFKMHNSRNFEYTLVMESAQAKLKKYKLRNIADRRLKFELTEQPQKHLQMLVDNLNERDSGWAVGECIDSNEKMIAYNHTSCDAALSQIADAFETEWEIVGKTIYLRKVEYNKDNPLPLSYGRGKGFKPGIGRTNFNDSNPVEILFVQGGDRNINATQYGSKGLLLPKSQTLVYEGRTYVSDSYGYSVRQDVPLKSKSEDSLDLSHIYPSRVGSVSSVVKIDAEKSLYDFIDDSIPDSLDFAKYIVEGERMTVVFQSGQLAGKEFEVKYIHDEITIVGKEKEGKRFEIVPQQIDGVTMPNEVFKPVETNTYAVFGIALPEDYVCNNEKQIGASWDMFREAAKYLYENGEQKFTFIGELDGIWAKKDWLNIGGRIKLGGYVLFSDPQFQPDGVGIRIVGIKDFINNPHSPEIELSNSIVGSSIMSDIRKIESNEVLTDSQHKDALQFTKRRFRDAQESMKMLEDAMLNFSGSVNPIAVKTMQVLLGDESLQYQFVGNRTNPKPVAHEVTYKDNILIAPAGILQHLTLGIDSLSSSHKASEYKFWDMNRFESAKLTDSDKSYYLYAKVNKAGTASDFYLSETAIEMDSVEGYYHLLYGTLGSEFEGLRSFVPWYGYSELTPGRLTIPKIVSPDGKTYFDVAGGEIGGKITFRSGSSGLENLDEWGEKQQQIDDAHNKANKAESDAAAAVADYNAKFALQQAQLDGEVSNWYYAYTPTLNNEPASTWFDDAEKDRHIGDTFLNTEPFVSNEETPNAGKAWRWLKVGVYYQWAEIADSDAVKALKEAAKAQSTADGKSTTYVVKPTKYSYGDTWILESTEVHSPHKKGEMLFASVSSESYNYDHWVTKVRYTDDAVANAAMALLADIASDGKLTPNEKNSTLKEWDIIISEKPKNDAQADIFGSDKTAYNKAFNALNDYLTPLLSDMTVTSNIVGDDFRAIFKAYYDARTELLNKSKNINYTSLTPPENPKIGDTWAPIGLGVIYIYYSSGWQLTADDTKTIINGGVVTSGTIQVGNPDKDGNPTARTNAGITGKGDLDTDVRFWAGATYDQRNNAPYKVLQDGSTAMTKATVTGTINATSGSIGGFNIEGGLLHNDPGNDNGGILFDYNTDNLPVRPVKKIHSRAAIGVNAMPSFTGMRCPAYFENISEYLWDENIASWFGASGGRRNYAINISKGCISGFAVRADQIDSDQTLDNSQCVVACYNSKTIYLYLGQPNVSEIGKMYIIKQMNASDVVVVCENNKIHVNGPMRTLNTNQRGNSILVINDGQYWIGHRLWW